MSVNGEGAVTVVRGPLRRLTQMGRLRIKYLDRYYTEYATKQRTPMSVRHALLALRIRRGGRRMTVDDQTLAAGTGPTTLTSPGFLDAAYRVNVTVESADHLTVTTTGRNELARAGPGDVMLAARTWFERFGPAGVTWPARDGTTSESNRSVA
jgi:hypothetical protein